MATHTITMNQTRVSKSQLFDALGAAFLKGHAPSVEIELSTRINTPGYMPAKTITKLATDDLIIITQRASGSRKIEPAPGFAFACALFDLDYAQVKALKFQDLHAIGCDIINRYLSKGKISPKQRALLLSLEGRWQNAIDHSQAWLREDLERQAKAKPLKEGRQQVKGHIVRAHWKSTDYGYTLKITLETSDYQRLYGSAPAFLRLNRASPTQALVGLCVAFDATVKQSRTDATFGRMSRPSATGQVESPALQLEADYDEGVIGYDEYEAYQLAMHDVHVAISDVQRISKHKRPDRAALDYAHKIMARHAYDFEDGEVVIHQCATTKIEIVYDDERHARTYTQPTFDADTKEITGYVE